jgi:hypothetical protein
MNTGSFTLKNEELLSKGWGPLLNYFGDIQYTFIIETTKDDLIEG